MFSKLDKNKEEKADGTGNSWKKHKTAIDCTRAMGPAAVSTSALDGKVVVWDLNASPVPGAVIGL